jgi:putative inorganic carbon (HCO3(-)) transporter
MRGGQNSLSSSLLVVMLSLGYVLTSNLLSNARLCESAINAVIFSSIPVSVYAIFEYFLGLGTDEYLDPSFVGVLGGRVTSTFTNPNIYAVYLIVAIIFSFGSVLKSKTVPSKMFYIGATLVNLLAMVFTWTRGAWLAIVVSLISFAILKIKHAPGSVIAAIAVCPYLVYLIPQNVLDRFLSIFNTHDTSVAHRFAIWRSSVNMLVENAFTGIGVGSEAFANEFLKYAEDGISAPHSHNLFLQIAVQSGLFAILAFLAILFVRAKHINEYRRYISSSDFKNPLATTIIATLGLIIFGMTDYIFYDMRMLFLFFALFGISSANLRIIKKENDDRLSYFGHDLDANASGIDVSIGK